MSEKIAPSLAGIFESSRHLFTPEKSAYINKSNASPHLVVGAVVSNDSALRQNVGVGGWRSSAADAGIHRGLREKYFDNNNVLRHSNEADLWGMSSRHLYRYLTDQSGDLSEFYEIGNSMATHYKVSSINGHGLDHAVWVTDEMLAMSDKLGLSEDIRRRVVLTGMFHDIGYSFGKNEHSLVGPAVALKMFPKLRENDGWKHINEAIKRHDGEVYQVLLDSWQRRGLDPLVEMSRWAPETLLLLMMDKIHIARDRAGAKARRSREAVDKHEHSQIVLIFETLGVDIRGDSIVIRLAFRPHMTPGEAADFEVLTRKVNGSNVVYLPQNLNNQHGLPDLEKCLELILRVYKSRFNIASLAGLTLTQKSNVVLQIETDPQFPGKRKVLAQTTLKER